MKVRNYHSQIWFVVSFTCVGVFVRASSGLRTLCIATAVIPPEFYEEWKEIYYRASTAIVDREEQLGEAAELIEKVSTQLYCLLKNSLSSSNIVA